MKVLIELFQLTSGIFNILFTVNTKKITLNEVLEQEPQIFIRATTVKNLINDRQFWIDIEQLRNILGPVKRAVKNVEFRTTSLADIFVELIKMAIAIQETSVLYNSMIALLYIISDGRSSTLNCIFYLFFCTQITVAIFSKLAYIKIMFLERR
ncbi:hypothetical protein C2G38_883757 [Gigaspora rosea]|uniref:Uncharacterized protein n=1 Tax=Gigaspora rosea TaxID=44941 RepID=A0A397TWF1_9GLOM|nr:hypothetical protein C2G38_883757 [Gigaspora rosea]